MISINDALLHRINNGPQVLFVGQCYLAKDTGEDQFIKSCCKKFGNNKFKYDSSIGYQNLLNLNIEKDFEATLTWMENLCKNISVPSWFENVAEFPWSNIYTTSIETILLRAFKEEWRNIQPLYDDSFRVLDFRNKLNLHITYLFGCISQNISSKRPPFSTPDLFKHRFLTNKLLYRIPEIVTNKGILIIEGYGEMDWLKVEDFYGVLSNLGENQVLLCNPPKELQNNQLIQDLIQSKILSISDSTFGDLLIELKNAKKLSIDIPSAETFFGKWINIDNKKVPLPQNLINKVSKTGRIIDESLFDSPSFLNKDEKYLSFKNFLASSEFYKHWQGYPNNFAFKRDYYKVLLRQVQDKISRNNEEETPIVLYGQSSSGKTISLKLLAYECSQKYGIPVIFIEKRYSKIDEFDIDTFCQWAEDSGAKYSLIIWDGMVDSSIYYNLLKKLNARGRKLILVGSTYERKKNQNSDNFIESPIDLSNIEKKQFLNFINEIDPILSNILSGIPDNNLLSMLYRYLPDTRESIKSGLKSEFDYFSKKLAALKPDERIESTTMFDAMVNAGLISQADTPNLQSSQIISGEEISLSDLLIFCVMVPGQFALNVPYELLLRTIGYESISSNFFKALNQIDIINWFEDSQGNLLLGPRTAIEAKILCNFLGGKNAEIDYIKILLKEIKSYDFESFGYESDPEIQFAVELLNNISPNETPLYMDKLLDITDVLKELRVSQRAYHPRLVLKEASFLRELVTNGKIDEKSQRIKLLENAERIVRDVLERLGSHKERAIANFLQVELASIIGSKAFEYVDKSDNVDEAKECYSLVKQINYSSFSGNPDNYNVLDVLAWTTDKLIKENVFNKTEKLNAEADLLHLFELAETEGISEQDAERFKMRKLSFFELLGRKTMADEMFEKLKKSGSSIGYYVRAKQMLGDVEINPSIDKHSFVTRNIDTSNYLITHYDHIKNDSKCLFLLLKTWWISKTKTKFFQEEKQAVPFSIEDWEFCYELILKLLFENSIYHSATTIYLQGICEFHLGSIQASLDTFKKLDIESDFSSYGRRRIVKSYLVSTPEGNPKKFTGEVKFNVSLDKNQKSGEVYISEIRRSIPFLLSEFGKREFQAGEKIDNFYIGFNFRGPIATPRSN